MWCACSKRISRLHRRSFGRCGIAFAAAVFFVCSSLGRTHPPRPFFRPAVLFCAAFFVLPLSLIFFAKLLDKATASGYNN
jgi:hypothetical protein